jgi:hypothetical protein
MSDAVKRKTVSLSVPVTFEGREITEIRIAKPKVKDLKRMNAALDGITDRLDQGIVMASALTGYPVEMIEELDTDDFTALSEVIADFFPKGAASPPGDRSLPKPPTG